MRARTALIVTVAAVGVGYAIWRLPVTRRFVATAKEASARREAELRAAVEVAVRTDATSRAPRHAVGAEVPSLDVAAGWDPDRRRGAATPLGAADPGRSLSPEEARALLLDPTRPGSPSGSMDSSGSGSGGQAGQGERPGASAGGAGDGRAPEGP